MLWHGSSYGYNLTNHICLIMSKAILSSASKIFFNIFTGFSAQDFVNDVYFILYAIFLTQYGFYTWTDRQLSNHRFSQDESLLHYKLSENYSMVRDNFISKIKHRFAVFLVMTYWGSFFSTLITMSTLQAEVNSTGQTLDQFAMGFATFTSFVFMVHIVWVSQMRDWNRLLVIFVVTIISLYPVSIIMA